MTSGPLPRASVIVLTRNGMPRVQQCLRAVLAQSTPWPFEVIVIDSDSTDGTAELIEALPVKRVRIRSQDFNHGTTRNFGAELAKSEFLVYLVQDAVPADNAWLLRLVQAAELPGAAASYSRQIPWDSDNPLVRLHMRQALTQPPERALQVLAPGEQWEALTPEKKFAMATFRNNASCIHRAVWAQYPFRRLPYGEDLDWGKRVIRTGYSIVYEPQSSVYHSHDRPSAYEMKRAYADHELVVRLFGYQLFPRLSNAVASWLRCSWEAARVVCTGPGPLTSRAALALRAPVVIGARHLGTCLGARAAQGRVKGPFWQYVDSRLRNGV